MARSSEDFFSGLLSLVRAAWRGRGREILIRGVLTLLLAAGLVALLATSKYGFDFAAIWTYRGLLLKGLLLTLAATAVAYVLGFALGIVVALLRLSRRLVFRHLGDLYVEVFRSTPFLVQLSLFYFGIAPILGLDNKFVIGTISLALFAASYSGEIIRAGIESIDRGQVEAARSLGLSRGQTMRFVVLPQALKRMIPPLTGELIALTKESSLLFFIGVVELFAVANQAGADTYRYLEAFLVAGLCYMIINVPLSLLSRRLEKKLSTSGKAGDHL
jgi:polar amino acid transport system permease protein